MRRKEPRKSPAQVRMSGSAISPPAVSPSHQVRQNVTASDQSMTPPASMETVPQTALIAVAVASATSMPMIWSARSSAALGPISRRSRIAPTMISSMFPVCWPTTLQNGRAWSPVSELGVDDELGDEDPGPEPQSPEVERGDPERRPAARPRSPRPCSGGSGRASRLRSRRGQEGGSPRCGGRASIGAACRRPARSAPVALAARRPPRSLLRSNSPLAQMLARPIQDI